MARRYNTATIRSNPAPAAAVNAEPSWVTQWDAATAGTVERSFPLFRKPSALELGERVEFGPGELYLVEAGRVAGGLVAGVEITGAGAGYTQAPTVSFTGGGGTGAAGTAVVESGVVVRVDITNPGSGYTSAPTVSFAGGGSPTTQAAGTALLNGFVSERAAAQQLAGETSAAKYYQLHNGNPGAAGTQNVIPGLNRIEQPSNNWTAA